MACRHYADNIRMFEKWSRRYSMITDILKFLTNRFEKINIIEIWGNGKFARFVWAIRNRWIVVTNFKFQLWTPFSMVNFQNYNFVSSFRSISTSSPSGDTGEGGLNFRNCHFFKSLISNFWLISTLYSKRSQIKMWFFFAQNCDITNVYSWVWSDINLWKNYQKL